MGLCAFPPHMTRIFRYYVYPYSAAALNDYDGHSSGSATGMLMDNGFQYPPLPQPRPPPPYPHRDVLPQSDPLLDVKVCTWQRRPLLTDSPLVFGVWCKPPLAHLH